MCSVMEEIQYFLHQQEAQKVCLRHQDLAHSQGTKGQKRYKSDKSTKLGDNIYKGMQNNIRRGAH